MQAADVDARAIEMAAASAPTDGQAEAPGPSLMSYRSLVYQPHTPDIRNRTTERVTGSRRGVDTVLTSYSATKQRTRVQLRTRAGTREGKVSLLYCIKSFKTNLKYRFLSRPLPLLSQKST